jgi:hypothetical protein
MGEVLCPKMMNGKIVRVDGPRGDGLKGESTSTTTPPSSPSSSSHRSTRNKMSFDALRQEVKQLRLRGQETTRQRNEELSRLDSILADKRRTLNGLLARQQQSSLCPTFWEYAHTIRDTFEGRRPSTEAETAKENGSGDSLPIATAHSAGPGGGGSGGNDHGHDDDWAASGEAGAPTTPPTSATSSMSTACPYTWYGWCEAWLLRSLHHAMNYKRQLDRVRADSNAQILFLYYQIEAIQEEESDVETDLFKAIHRASQRNSHRRKLWQHYLHVQESMIQKLQRWDQVQSSQTPGVGQLSYELVNR